MADASMLVISSISQCIMISWVGRVLLFLFIYSLCGLLGSEFGGASVGSIGFEN